ncbi:hypothetical protein FQN54_005746 [Arachnomyces sp. PD_36]|nr:hypothetical protein FQN54_005746 [Arachnomyces sp. PD_36]
MPQPLSSKDASSFRQVVRHYENKHYKKGLKLADQLLRKNPNHSETQAMKALIISNMDQQEEAFTLAKLALKNDMKSHICWHVYGLLYRADKNFDEAIKAYKFALKLEPDSQPIQRDLALLQIQMRDYQGYVQSRNAMLQAKPGFRQNWTALAIAHHLAGNLTDAENVLTTYEETLKTPPSRADMEHSEAVLYKNTIIAESGDLEKALEHLDSVGKKCADVLAVMELRADYLLRLERHAEAAAAYEALLERNPENSNYYDGLIIAKKIDDKDHKALKALYDEWVEKNPRGDAARRLPLDFLQGDEFRAAVDTYLQRMLKKQIPSTFANIKALYANTSKRDVVQELVEGYASNGLEAQENGSTDKESNGNKSAIESVYYFLSQHYNYHLSRNLPKAMEYIDKALELSPNSLDYYMTKARIWKHYGHLPKAIEAMEKARTIEENDRYINSKTAKYQLRNDQSDDALKNMSKFTRNETVGGALGDLHEMQCVWYLTEDGESYLRQRKLGLALKRLSAVYNIFEIWQDDQFDFHTFSLRKGMIRAYVDMVRWEDHLRDHPFYTRAALSAIKAYLLLHDQPDLAHGPIPSGMNGVKGGDGADSAERKKALKKAKREQQKLEKAEAEKREARKNASAKGSEDTKKEDTDPLGTKLVQTTEPVKEAVKYLTPLLEFSPGNIEVQLAGFEVNIRRNKYVLALKCLMASHSIDPSNPTLHSQIYRFKTAIDNPPEPLNPKISEIITPELDTLLSPKSSSLAEWNESFLTAHKTSAPHVHAAASVRRLINPDSQSQGEKDLLSTLELKDTSLADAVAGLQLLNDWSSSEDVKSQYIQTAHKRWPEASTFEAESE